jgi:aquaporin related protein
VTSQNADDSINQFLTAYLTLTVLMLAAEKSKDTFIAPIGIGLVLFSICLADVNYSGASFNPARSLAPCIVAASFPGYHWIHWLGPIMGATLAAGCYHCIKVSGLKSAVWDTADFVFFQFFNYEDVNGGQDSAGYGDGFHIK